MWDWLKFRNFAASGIVNGLIWWVVSSKLSIAVSLSKIVLFESFIIKSRIQVGKKANNWLAEIKFD